MAARIEHLGHAAFRIASGQATVYIDPYKLPADAPKATVILVTHEHYDHCSPEDVGAVANTSTVVLAPGACAAKLEGLSGKLVSVEPGGTYDAGGMQVRTVPAYNVDKRFHPQGAGHVGYLVSMAAETIYHAGDTDCIPEMEGLKPDVALLPVGGTYTMNAEEAAEAFRKLGAKRGVPMHYGSVAGTKADAERFLRLIGATE